RTVSVDRRGCGRTLPHRGRPSLWCPGAERGLLVGAPLRMILFVLAVAAGFVVVYTLFVDSGALKLPLLVSSLAVLAITLGILGFALAGSAFRMTEAGRGGAGVLTALIAGIFVLIACGSLAGAIILGILA